MMRKVHIYTDGSCDVHSEDKPGGWAVILVDIATAHTKQLSGSKLHTTIGEMEILAAVEGLAALRGGPHDVTVCTDSQYLVGAMNGNKRKKNRRLLAELDELVDEHDVTFKWVRGHEDTTHNLLVDKLAVAARKGA
jgi:ribonuclease HI